MSNQKKSLSRPRRSFKIFLFLFILFCFRNLLEKSYHLCTNCEQVVDRTLNSQRFELNIPPDSHFEKQAIENIIVTKNISKSREKFKSIFKFFSNFIVLWLNIVSVSGNNEGDYFAWREYISVYQVCCFPLTFTSLLTNVQFLFCFRSSLKAKSLSGKCLASDFFHIVYLLATITYLASIEFI